MKSRKTAVLAAASACACAVFFALDAIAVTTAKSYIQDGLVAHWDGIENAGYGLHDDMTNVWTDLKGFCDLAVVDSASTWANDAFVPPQKNHKAAARDEGDVAKITVSTYDSIDVCLTRKTVSNAACVLGQSNRMISWQKAGFVCYCSKRSCHATLVNDTPYSIYAEYKHGSNAVVLTNYLDGVAVAEEEDSRQELFSNGRFQISRDYNEYFSSRAPVNSVRLYSRALEPWEILVNANVDQIRFRRTDGATLTWPEGLCFMDGSVCYRTTATTKTYSSSAAVDNKIRVDDGEPSAALTAWKPTEETCTLTPVPDANHKFSFWEGDVDGLEVAADGTLTLDNSVRSVTAVFVPGDASGVVREWTGEAGDGNWTTAGNWSPAGIPGSYDSLTVPAGQTAVLGTGEDTPLYLSVDCAGTLVLSNWTTRLRAFADINVLNGGVLTCADAILSGDETASESYADQTFSRVWVACSNLTVFAGGMIDLKLKGWRGAPGTIQCRGYGPGSSPNNFGAAHGGHGGGATGVSNGALLTPSMPYDDPCAPVQPGSSGASYHANSNNCRGSSGGGALRVEASGVVTVDGTIIADGQDALGYGQSSVRFAKAASGGSVYITCREIAGSGVISANGGGGDSPTGSAVPGYSGGGGCIAIYYDVNAQQASSVRGMKITAAAGQYRCYGSYKPGAVGELGADGKTDVGRKKSDIGTLRFSDRKIVDELLGNGLSGQIAGISPYVYDGDLSFDYGHVRFADTGAVVTVTGSLVLGGEDSRLEIGGCETKWRTVHVDIYGGDKVNRLTVGGDLTLGGVSRLDIRSAETNGVDAFGAVVKVGGTMTIGTNCFVYSWSDVINTGSPHFEVGGLNVATGGVFSAKRRGGAGAYTGRFHIYGNSAGKNSGTGGGHGGAGGYATATRGAVSDNEERPSMPGAGGGSLSGYAIGGAGGGVVSVAATNGTIRIDGTVVCDGESMSGYCAGGAGGALLLEAGRLVVGETGVLSAKGGAVTPSKYTTACTGGGGGGRIALYCGQPWSASLPRRRTNRSSVPFAADEYPDEFILLGTVDASGGETKGTYADNGKAGEDGTVLYCYVKEPAGIILIVK